MSNSVKFAAALSVLLLAGSGTAFAQQEISKVNGSIDVATGEVRADVSTVNGSIKLGNAAKADDVTTVNGEIALGNNASAKDVTTVNGGIKVGSGARIASDATTVNGSVFVADHGVVGGDVTTVNGGIGLVRAEVGGDVATVNGDVTVGIGSHVKGKLLVKKATNNSVLPISIGPNRIPRIIVGPNAVVDGELQFEREVKLYVHKSARVGKITGATAVAYSTPTAPAK